MKNALINWFYFGAGLVFLALSRAKYAVRGYTQSSFSTKKVQSLVEYDFGVVDTWIKQLQEYTDNPNPDILNNRRILELGPGCDLGVGLYLLARSAKEYNAVDTYNLIKNTPKQFYNVFFSSLESRMNINTKFLSEEFDRTMQGKGNKLKYVCDKDFDIIKAMGSCKVDTVFSQAAFEHFDNIEETIKAVSKVCDSGSNLIAIVDLQTHSRWIRHKDPNNIYRYPEWLYNLFRFRGTPNRIRPYQYKNSLERNGWVNVKIYTDMALEEERLNSTIKYLHKPFTHEKNQMHYLSVWICATKS